MRLDLYQCGRCKLIFAWNEEPKKCPQCQRTYSGTTEITLAAHSVEIPRVRVIEAKPVIRGVFDNVDLGTRCSHGMIHPSLCRFC